MRRAGFSELSEKNQTTSAKVVTDMSALGGRPIVMAVVATIALALFIAALVMIVGARHRAEPTGLVEDVTDPLIKHRFISKFQRARARHEGSSMHRNDFSNAKATMGGSEMGNHKKKRLTDAQKAKIAEQMKKLRAEILNDYSSNTKFGKRVDCSYP
eukprot:738341-Hanusia_phi.AAC.2